LKAKVDKMKYPHTAWVYKRGEWERFSCKVVKKSMITTDVGEQMESRSRTIYTKSDIVFRQNDKIWLSEQEQFRVEDSNSEQDLEHGGVYRGAPRYNTTMEVR